MTDTDIAGLAAAAAAGEDVALNRLLAAVQPQVMAICSRMLPCRQDAEEACQDAMLQVARKIGSFEGRSKFSTWLYVVASNSARGTYRSLKRRAAERPGMPPVDPPNPRTTSVIAGTRLDLLDALERLEDARADLVGPLVLRDLHQLSYTEIADELGVPMGTIKSRIHDARIQMRAFMNR